MKFFYILFLTSALAANSVAQRVYRQGIPTSLPVNYDNMEWKRDIYREINLSDNNNAGLGFLENGENLFVRIFDLVLTEKIKAYEFSVDGTESFNEENEVEIKSIMKDFQIHFEENPATGQIFVENDDMPTEEVMGYYMRETMFYDITNSLFRVRPAALCPVLWREDDFEDSMIKYPLFWVKFDELEPYLCDLFIHPRGNMMRKMAASDYFARNLYHGEIYKVFNVRNIALSQYCEDEAALRTERERIETELRDVKNVTYNTFHRSEVLRMQQEEEERIKKENEKREKEIKKVLKKEARKAEKVARKATRKPFRFSTIKRWFTE